VLYLPRDRAAASPRGWTRLTVADFAWPMPGEAFWRILGSRDPAAADATAVYRRPLHFYAADPPAWLIAVDGGESMRDGVDRVAYLVQVGTQLHALTGGSDVVHALNERYGGPREGSVLDYIEFFCSFVAGDEGPFLVPRDDGERDEVAGQDVFAIAAQQARERLVLGDDSPRAAPEAAMPPARLELLPDERRADVRAAAEKAGWRDTESATFAQAHVIYGSAVFAATFALARDGNIEMLDDEPLASLQTVTRHRFVEDAGTSWLVREWGGRVRQRIEARDFLARLHAAPDDTATLECAVFRHLEVIGDVVFPACCPVSWLYCQYVDFRGSVVLDDCRALDRVDFEACRFFGSFSARRAVFDKSLALRRCQVFALSGDSGRPAAREQDRFGSRDFGGPVAIALDSAQVAIDLDLERTTGHATLRARRLRIGGNANLAGLRVLPVVVPLPAASEAADAAVAGSPERFAASASSVQLDLSDSEFGGSVNLNCALDHAAVVQMKRFALHCHRSVVAGTLRLDGARIQGSLWIRGLCVPVLRDTRGGAGHVALFSLRQARIEGSLQNYDDRDGAWPPTRILGELDLTCASFGNYAHFDGAFIAGDLEFGAVTAQSVSLKAEWRAPQPAPDAEYGGAEPWFDHTGARPDAVDGCWRPCFMGGDVSFNNARISGTVFVDGGWIDGMLHARDGARLGSLLFRSGASLSTEEQPDGSSLGIVRHPARVGAIELETAEIHGTVAILDTEVASHASIVNARIAGDLDFYGTAALRRSFVADLRTGYAWSDPDYPIDDFVERALGRSPPVTVVGARAAVGQGSLRVRGSTIGGSVDISNVRVQDDLVFEDTSIGGDFATAQPRVLGGPGERLFQALEGGQRAVTPLLDLEGCRAAVLEVHGKCIDDVVAAPTPGIHSELANRSECRRFVFDALQCRGDARLWRLRASRSVSGRHAEVRGSLSFYVAGEGLGPVPAASDGSGDRSVRLERADFGQLTLVEPFPPSVHLRGIRVGQWSPRSGRDAREIAPAGPKVDWPERADLMLKILDRMPDDAFEPAVYLEVERYFRASGQDELADGIYCALRDRQAAEEESDSSSGQALWLWLALLAPPLAVVAAGVFGLPGAGRLLMVSSHGPTLVGLLVGLLAPWLLVWANPPRRAGAAGPAAWLRGPGVALPPGLLRLGIIVAFVLALVSSAAVQVVVTVAALSFWIHVALLVPPLVASRRLRVLVLGRLMQRLGTAWGTAAHRLVLVWLLLLFAPLAIVLHQPRNVEPTLLARGTLKLPAEAKPDPAAWAWNGVGAPPTWIWMAVESTVPIISIGAEDKWEAADRPPVVLDCVGPGAADAKCNEVVLPFGTSAKQVESFLRLIGWLFWPLAAAGFAASFIHRRQAAP
jgi:hypothetical protein